MIAEGSKYIGAVDEMLTLTGLRIVYERNLDRHKKRGPLAVENRRVQGSQSQNSQSRNSNS